MGYTEPEVAFLMKGHGAEHATGNSRVLEPVLDLRNLGCPTRIFEKILEHRAKKLGRVFTEFRASNRTESNVTDGKVMPEELAAVGIKLF